MDLYFIKKYLQTLHEQLIDAFEAQETSHKKFFHDLWTSSLGEGETCILEDGSTFAQAGVSFSHIQGKDLPISAKSYRSELAGWDFEVMGVSVVSHPKNPYVPTSHANVRIFVAQDPTGQKDPVWWFGGGFDLTPYYVFDEDIFHWHQVAKGLCEPFGAEIYPQYKKWCDEYFYLKHRQETRGIGGLFFDDLNRWNFETCFAFMQAVGEGYMKGYIPIVEKRKEIPWGATEESFQQYRRGRYVEFNLLYDRGTIFGLHSGGRTHSILMSLPPSVRWGYAWQPAPNSREALLSTYLQARDWLEELQPPLSHS
jgi:coproporphyrinogen III oxidase